MNKHIVITPATFLICTILSFSLLNCGNQKNSSTVSDKMFTPDTQTITKTEIDDEGFEPLPKPGPHDWLANHHEEGQTFDQFLSDPRNKLTKKRNTIYLLPMWNFDKSKSPSLELLKSYTEIYFQIPVKLLPAINPDKNNFSPRINPGTNKEQVHAGEILLYLLKHIPSDAYCVLGITMCDLYPDPDWNYVFGYASYQERVGVFSFARFDRSFFDTHDTTDQKLLFTRSCRVLTHETGHMFGMAHCIAYHCNMNGSNNLQESDAQPLNLCPVCLKKLCIATELNIQNRYEALEEFYNRQRFVKEAQWVLKRLDKLITTDDTSAN